MFTLRCKYATFHLLLPHSLSSTFQQSYNVEQILFAGTNQILFLSLLFFSLRNYNGFSILKHGLVSREGG